MPPVLKIAMVNTPPPRKDPERRARDLNALYHQGHGNSLDILRADFNGDWPPSGLTITRPPEKPLRFERYFSLSATAAHVDNTERAVIIHMNRQHMLEEFFTKASRNIADLVSHENIHILQKILIHQGLCDPFGRGGSRSPIHKMLKPFATPAACDLASADEIQARLHEVTAHHYRKYAKIPLNPAQLRAMLYQEGVALEEKSVLSLEKSEEGLEAMTFFPAASYPQKWIKPDVIRDLNSIIFTIRDDRKHEFCMTTLPLLYGGLLELYGDREGARRMGYTHNITLTDLFFRQAWNLQHDEREGRKPNPAKIEATIFAMPEDQAANLLKHIFFHEAYTHPVTGRTMELKPHGTGVITALLLQRAKLDSICGG